jgi:hypothetical protein
MAHAFTTEFHVNTYIAVVFLPVSSALETCLQQNLIDVPNDPDLVNEQIDR